MSTVPLLSRIRGFEASVKGRIFIAVASMAVMMLLTWLGDRLPYTFGDESLKMKEVELLSRMLGKKPSRIPDGYLPVNVGYDRQLVEIYDEYGMPLGNVDITDREKLYRLLASLAPDSASQLPPYKLIVIDVAFDSALVSDADSILYDKIVSMPRVILVSGDAGLKHEALEGVVSVPSQYSTSFNETGFVKIPFKTSSGAKTLPTVIYESAYDDGAGSCDNWLCQPAIYLKLPIRASDPYDDNGEKNFYNLGTDLLDVYSPAEMAELAGDRIVIVGDYTTSDLHDTYAGVMSGPVIVINAIEALRNGDNRIKWLSALLLAIGYFCISYTIIHPLRFPWQRYGAHGKLWGILLSLIGYSMSYALLMLVDFLIFGEVHDMFLPGLWIVAIIFIDRKIIKSEY